jgi:tetratricopeptide (TPR) repeat protein
MKTHSFWCLLLALVLFSEVKLQAQKLNELDSLLKILPSLPKDTNKIKKYARVGWLYGETNSNTDFVKKYADSIQILSQELKYERGIALSHFYYGFNARHEGNYDEAQRHLNIFIKYFSEAGDSTKVANGLYQLGVIYSFMGNYEKGLSIYFRILNISKFKNEPYGVATALQAIGNTYMYTENYGKAIEYFKQSLKILHSLEGGKPTQSIAVHYTNLGNIYLNLAKNDTARIYFLKALRISEELGNDWGIAGALENLGYIAFRSKDYQQAMSFHKRTLVIRERLAQKRELAISLSNVGATYLKMKDYVSANRYLLESLAKAKEIGYGFLVYDVYKDLSTLMAEKKDVKGAYEYHRLYAKAKDSVLNLETTQQLRELQTKYETVEKNKKIALLAKEKEIQGKEMQRQAALNKAYIGGFFFLIAVAGLVFYILRQRVHLTTKNTEIKEADFRRQLTELEMKALRAQINPHFLFNCMNAINLMILKGQTENASLYLAKFSKLVRLLLENAEAPAVTLASEMSLLESYIQLEELRLPGRIGYTISVDECIGVQSTYLPSMVLQPVVENAIWHGIVHRENESKGNIFINVSQQEDQLLCTIEDNGVGRDRAQQLRDESAVKNRSMGMKITEERLRLRNRNRKEQCIQITDLKDTLNQAVGTRVTIHIPIEEQYA